MSEFSREQLRHPYIVERQDDYPEGWWIKNEVTGAAIMLNDVVDKTFTGKYEAYRACNIMNRIYADLYDYIQSLPALGQSHE
jgi:hypothetical protein